MAEATAAGADAADAVLFETASLEASYRLGKLENVERSESRDVGIRILIGQKQALVSTTDAGEEALNEVVERCVAMARTPPNDPYCGLADRSLLETSPEDLDLDDQAEPDLASLTERAAEAEDAALSVTGVTNSEGGGAGWEGGQSRLPLRTAFEGPTHRPATASRPL